MLERTPIPSIPVIADRPRNLRYSAGAVARLEEAYNKPVAAIFDDLIQQVRTGQIRVRMILEVAVAGMQHEDEGLTWQKLGDGMALQDVPKLLGPVGDAIRAAFPASKGDEDPNASGRPSA